MRTDLGLQHPALGLGGKQLLFQVAVHQIVNSVHGMLKAPCKHAHLIVRAQQFRVQLHMQLAILHVRHGVRQLFQVAEAPVHPAHANEQHRQQHRQQRSRQPQAHLLQRPGGFHVIQKVDHPNAVAEKAPLSHQIAAPGDGHQPPPNVQGQCHAAGRAVFALANQLPVQINVHGIDKALVHRVRLAQAIPQIHHHQLKAQMPQGQILRLPYGPCQHQIVGAVIIQGIPIGRAVPGAARRQRHQLCLKISRHGHGAIAVEIAIGVHHVHMLNGSGSVARQHRRGFAQLGSGQGMGAGGGIRIQNLRQRRLNGFVSQQLPGQQHTVIHAGLQLGKVSLRHFALLGSKGLVIGACQQLEAGKPQQRADGHAQRHGSADGAMQRVAVFRTAPFSLPALHHCASLPSSSA